MFFADILSDRVDGIEVRKRFAFNLKYCFGKQTMEKKRNENIKKKKKTVWKKRKHCKKRNTNNKSKK